VAYTSKDYYKVLLKLFGHAYCSGAMNLAKLLELYNRAQAEHEDIDLQTIYNYIADEIKKNPAAIERSIRVYLKAVISDVGIDYINETLDYKFKQTNTITISEFLPVFSLYFNELKDLESKEETE
jgi:hypothetical protein